MLDHAVLDLQALHVLATDVQDEVDVGDEGLGAAQVGDRLDLAGVGLERGLQDALAVAGRGHMADRAARRQKVVDHVHDLAGHADHVAVVVAVPGPEELAVLADHGRLDGGGAGVDADEDAALVALERALGHDLGVVALLELAVLLLGRKERVEARDLAALGVAQVVEGIDDLAEGYALAGLACQRGARRDEEVRVLRDDAVLLVQVERLVEAVAQLGEVLERAAEEGHVAADGVTARQARDRLVGDGLEDGGGDVLARRALVEQGLDVGLGEDTAAARDRVDVGGGFGQLVEARRVRLEQ